MKYLLAIVFAVGILLFALACALEPEESPAAGTDTGKTETSNSAATPATGTASETDTDRMPETATDANGRADAAETEEQTTQEETTEEETTVDDWVDETVPVTAKEEAKVSDSAAFGDEARNGPIGILTCSPRASWEEFLAAQESGDALSEAFYRRNLEVADRMQCRLTITSVTGSGSGSVMYEILRRDLLAASCDYEIAYGPQEPMTDLFKLHALWNLDEFEDFDPTASRWSTGYLEESSYAGGHYMVTGKGALSAYRNLNVTLVDRTLLQAKDGKTLFDTVKNGEWTLDTMQALLLENLPADTDAFSLPDPGVYRVPYDGFLRAFGMRFLTHSQDGVLEVADFDVKQIDLVQERFLSFRNQSGVRMDKESEDEVLAHLANGQVRATCNVLGVLEEPLFADRNAEFVALPIPKLTAQQTEYGVTFAKGVRVYGILSTAPGLERLALAFHVMDALCSRTEETVVPVYLAELFGEDAAQKDLISGMVSMVSPDPIAVYLPNEQFSAADLMQGGKASSYVTRRKRQLLKEVSNLNKRYER